MEKFNLTVSRHPRTTKPNLITEWRELSDTISPPLTFEEFVRLIGDYGHSFCHAVCDIDIRYKNFVSSQLLVLDIDNKEQVFHPVQVLERLHNHGLDCNAMYVTFSDPSDSSLSESERLKVAERYRIIFVLEQPVTSVVILKDLLMRLYSIFPEADSRCHATQIWAGGKGVIYKNENYRLSPMMLINLTHALETKQIGSKRKIEKFREKIRALPNEIFQEGENQEGHLHVPKMVNCNNTLLQPVKNGTSLIVNFDWGAARNQCKLLDDFLGLRRRIEHGELFGLYTAMRRIKGGKKLWKTAIEENRKISDEKIHEINGWANKWEESGGIVYEESLRNYLTPDDPAFSRYYRLTDIHFSRQNEARKFEDHYHAPLIEAELKFKQAFHNALSEIGNGVYVFKCATGLGKSEELLHTDLNGCIVAAPTHKLKEELSRRMTAAKIKHIVIPELPHDLPEVIRKKYDAYLAAGFFHYANGYLRGLKTEKLLRLGVSLEEATALSFELKWYFNKIKIATEKKLPVLTTHKRIAHTDFPNHSTIIFDEDVTETIGEIKTVSLKDVRLTLKRVEEGSIIHDILSSLVIHSADPKSTNKWLTLNDLISENKSDEFTIEQSTADELVNTGIRSEVASLLNAEALIIEPEDYRDPDGEKSIHFIVRNEIPKDKKIIVLSATADKFIYEHLFENVNFFDLSVVEMQGTAIQYSNRGFSKASWFSENTQKALEKISTYIADKPTITYKGQQYQQQFKNPFMHFENVVGTDELKGQNIAVVGTPNKPVFFYHLWAFLLRIEYNLEDAILSERIVRRNGFEFNFMTFENPDLQEVQFHFIEATLVQAVGRARLLRTNATVELFSRYPLIGFEQRNLRDLPDSNDGHLTHKVYSTGETAAVYSLPVSGSLAS